MSQPEKIAIVGAGIMGRLLGWQLQGHGFSVSLFDKDPISHGCAAAYTAAGMLAPYSELESADTIIYRLGQRSLQLWPDIAASLNADKFLHQRGTLVVAHAQDQADLVQFHQHVMHKLTDCENIACLDKAALHAIEPELCSQFQEAIFLRDESWVYTDAMMAALANNIQASGASWYARSAVRSVAPFAIETASATETFDYVIDCRGLGAKDDIAALRGVRGELIHVHAPEVKLRHMVRLMHPRYNLYLVPRDNGHFILGATQIETEDNSPISVRSAMELLSALYVIHPGFAEARILATKVNCRPALPDNLPLVETLPGLIRVNGLFRHGFLLAPALAEQVMQNFIDEVAPAPAVAQIYR